MPRLGKVAKRILRTLRSEAGPRQPNVLRGLAPSQNEFEQAIGQLFIYGAVEWIGKTSGRRLAARGR